MEKVDMDLISYIRKTMNIGHGTSINTLGKIDIPTLVMLMDGYATHKVNEYADREKGNGASKTS